MTYISKCEHGIAMALCQKCFPDVSEQNDWSKYVNAHPVKEQLTDEEIQEAMEFAGIHPSKQWGLATTGNVQLMIFARAILKKAQEK